MGSAVLKTLVLLILIGIGLLLKSKIRSKEKVNGIKDIILSIALPSTIFIALMKVELDSNLLYVPLLALIFNFLMFAISPLVGELFGISRGTKESRTLILMLGSLAPGLSCFPFVAEFLGEESLALAALADVGNKFYGLIFLYMIALSFYLKRNQVENQNTAAKIKSLLLNLLQEPINIILGVALMLLAFGFNYASLPDVVKGVFDKTSAIMTPLVLIYIGLAVKLRQKQKRKVLSILLFKAGVSLLLSAILIKALGVHEPNLILLLVVFPLSAMSFWPFAHITLFDAKEEGKKTFSTEFAVMMLAISLPLSCTLILGVLTFGEHMTDLNNLVVLATALLGLSALPSGVSWLFKLPKVLARM